MRIIFIISNLNNGGAQRAVTVFANQLAKMGEDVHIVCTDELRSDYEIDQRIMQHLICLPDIRIPKIRGACNILSSVAQIRKLAGDVLIPFYPPLLLEYGVRLWLSSMFTKTKIVHAIRCSREQQFFIEKNNWKAKIAYYSADGIWTQTKQQQNYFPLFLRKRIFCVTNILDSRFLAIPENHKDRIRSFISVGRIHPQKNQKLLIRAFAQMLIRTGDPYTTLTIYGRARTENVRLEQELRALICELHLEGRVFLPGRVSDIEQKYAEADAFVFGSDYEGCPNALMEAMAAGLPCVSTDCPTGPSDLITNGTNGLLVPVGDAEAMSRAMQYLVENPQEADRMGRAARQRMSLWGSPEETAGQLLRQLRKLCS